MRKKISIIVVLFLTIILTVGVCYLIFREDTPISEYETNVNKITKISIEDRQKQVDQIVENGKINIQYSLGALFNGTTSEHFNVTNIENNKYPIRFKIYDENDNIIYESKQIQTGYEINSIELNKELSKGMHECKIEIGYVNEGNVSSVFPLNVEVK